MYIVFMVAGISSRFNGKIKQFAEIGPNNETLIEISINQSLVINPQKIIFIVGEKTEIPFKQKFGDSFKHIPILYVKQSCDHTRDKPWGTVDAISCLKGIPGPFIICNGDDLYGENTFKFGSQKLLETGSNINVGFILKNMLPTTGTANRGVFELKDDKIVYIKEYLDISIETAKELLDKPCSVNFLGLQQKVIDELYELNLEFKDNHKNDRKIEHLLPDALNILINRGMEMYGYVIEGECIGVTRPEDVEKVRYCLKKKFLYNKNE